MSPDQAAVKLVIPPGKTKPLIIGPILTDGELPGVAGNVVAAIGLPDAAAPDNCAKENPLNEIFLTSALLFAAAFAIA